MGHAEEEHEGFQDFGVAQAGVAGMLLLRFAVFLHHGLQLGRDRLLGETLGRLFIMQAGIDEPVVAASERGKASNQVAIMQSAVGAGASGKGITQAHDQVLVVVEELVLQFHLQEQGGGVESFGGTRLFVLASLLQVRTVAGAVEGDFALFAATLGADAAVNGGAKALFLSNFADGAGHEQRLLLHYGIPESNGWLRGKNKSVSQKLLGRGRRARLGCEIGDFSALSDTYGAKNRIKCGSDAVFPQDGWYKMAHIAANQKQID